MDIVYDNFKTLEMKIAHYQDMQAQAEDSWERHTWYSLEQEARTELDRSRYELL